VDQAALVARVRSILRIKELHDTVREQAQELAQWNGKLEERVASQLDEIGRMDRLRRFLSPQIAKLVLSSGTESVLESHRREITVVFCDLRGFTAFSETAEPEEVLQVLREYHETLGRLIHKYEATLERFAGDAIMAWFNDPLPCPNPSERAVRMAVDMRADIGELERKWRKHGHELGFGVGIAQGYATLGRIGFEGRFDYAAIGTVVNLAARLCSEAGNGQILIDRKVQAATEALTRTEPVGEFTLKGLHRPVMTFNVQAVATEAGSDAQTPGAGLGVQS
jgi:class 3 adenylate cyclase